MEGKLQMLVSPRKNGLTSLFKEIGVVFKVALHQQVFMTPPCLLAPQPKDKGPGISEIEVVF